MIFQLWMISARCTSCSAMAWTRLLVPEKSQRRRVMQNYAIVINSKEVEKPDEIHLLLSMGCNYLDPVPVDKKWWYEGMMILYLCHDEAADG